VITANLVRPGVALLLAVSFWIPSLSPGRSVSCSTRRFRVDIQAIGSAWRTKGTVSAVTTAADASGREKYIQVHVLIDPAMTVMTPTGASGDRAAPG
jgi:hypothetical protein